MEKYLFKPEQRKLKKQFDVSDNAETTITKGAEVMFAGTVSELRDRLEISDHREPSDYYGKTLL